MENWSGMIRNYKQNNRQMHGSEALDIVNSAEKDGYTVAGNAEDNSNKALRKRSHALRWPVIRVFGCYAVILKPLVGKFPEQICNQCACEHTCHNG